MHCWTLSQSLLIFFFFVHLNLGLGTSLFTWKLFLWNQGEGVKEFICATTCFACTNVNLDHILMQRFTDTVQVVRCQGLSLSNEYQIIPCQAWFPWTFLIAVLNETDFDSFKISFKIMGQHVISTVWHSYFLDLPSAHLSLYPSVLPYYLEFYPSGVRFAFCSRFIHKPLLWDLGPWMEFLGITAIKSTMNHQMNARWVDFH